MGELVDTSAVPIYWAPAQTVPDDPFTDASGAERSPPATRRSPRRGCASRS